MKLHIKRILAVVFFLLALVVALGAVRVVRYAENATLQVADEGPGGPTERLEQFFDALKRRDFPTAYSYLSNYSSLGLEQTPEDPIAALYWEAQQSVWDFEVLPGHEMNGTRLSKTVRVRCMDAAAVSAPIGEAVQASLAAVVEAATEDSQVYDEDGNYHAELIDRALYDAAVQALQAAPEHTYNREITVQLDYLDGEWRIAADNQLLSALTSGAVR